MVNSGPEREHAASAKQKSKMAGRSRHRNFSMQPIHFLNVCGESQNAYQTDPCLANAAPRRHHTILFCLMTMTGGLSRSFYRAVSPASLRNQSLTRFALGAKGAPFGMTRW